eukprot:1176274-Amphidinium_carterae.1
MTGTGAGMAPAASPLPPSSSTDPLAPRPLTPLPPTGALTASVRMSSLDRGQKRIRTTAHQE